MTSLTLTVEQELEAQQLLQRIQEESRADLLNLARLLVSKRESEIFGATEFQARDLIHRVGAKAFEVHLAKKKNGYRGSSIVCTTCHQAAEFQGYRSKKPLSLLGEITCLRAYYVCHRCGHGAFPWDEAVGLTSKRLTPAAEQAASMAGVVCNSFAEASDNVLRTLAGLRLSESTVQRTTEDAGERVGQRLAEGKTFGFPRPWEWHRDAQGRTCAYVSIDATGVRQQAKDGGKADGRMPYVAMVYNPVPDLPEDSPYLPSPQATMQARYLAGLYDLDDLGLQLRKQAGQVGMDQAEQWIGLTDGGNGLENFVTTHFPRNVTLILDFWHASEYLRELAKTLHPDVEEVRQQQYLQWCHLLKQEGGQAMIAHLLLLPLPPRKPSARQQLSETLNYFQNNVHRMDYPTYEAKGWLIGSGAMESACKTVVGQRLKLAGMRWREEGTDDMCHLRALFQSEPSQWQAFWQRSIN
jgi:hypothetical protein